MVQSYLSGGANVYPRAVITHVVGVYTPNGISVGSFVSAKISTVRQTLLTPHAASGAESM